MLLDEAIENAIDGFAVSFVGTGFSVGATNIDGRSLPMGPELARIFAKECDQDLDMSIDDAADVFLEKYGSDQLIKKIQRFYTVKQVTQYHREVAKIPWRHIYTTNYDDVIETAYRQESKRITPITLSQDISKVPKQGPLCIHLNGFVDKLDRSTIMSELKLTDASYLTASLIESEWLMMFRKDIRLSRAVFIIGYSLYDLDIRRILFESQSLRDKCFFILGPNPPQKILRRAKKFGNVFTISTQEFADCLQEKSNSYTPIDSGEFQPLSIKEYKASIPSKKITDKAFIDLLLLGDLKKEFVSESLTTGKKYYLKRDVTERVFDYLRKNKLIVVTSSLGNGKSVFLDGLHYRALEHGYRVFEVQEHNEEAAYELDKIAQLPDKNIVTIDNYPDWRDEIRSFVFSSSPKTVLILTAREALHDVLVDELHSITKIDEIPEINLNRLKDEEIEWFVDAFDEYGLWGEFASEEKYKKIKYIEVNCGKQIHAILLKFLNSPTIAERFQTLYNQIKERRDTYNVMITIFIMNVLNQSPTLDSLVDIWGTNAISYDQFKKNPAVCQLIDFNRNIINVKSSIASEHLIKNYTDTGIILKILIHITKRAHDLGRISARYNDLFTNLMRFSNLMAIFPEEGRRHAVIHFYESIKNLRGCKTKPLFWLQYAIACLVLEELFRAETYFKTAYSFVNHRDFDPYQIDNHYARFLLINAIKNKKSDEAMKFFRRAQTIINRQLKTERRHYPYRVAILYQGFLERFYIELAGSDIEWIQRAAAYVLKKEKDLPDFRKRHKYIKQCKRAMEDIVDRTNEILEDRKITEDLEAGQEDENEE